MVRRRHSSIVDVDEGGKVLLSYQGYHLRFRETVVDRLLERSADVAADRGGGRARVQAYGREHARGDDVNGRKHGWHGEYLRLNSTSSSAP
jgi:hypothetical protein